MVPPPKWKMALVILLAIYPLLLVVLPLMGWIFEGILWLGVPITVSPEFFVRTLVTAVILVALMTWVAMPLLTRLFRPWLQSKS
jgi:antibiotic biosynthesis monooxygenase (ABM) superfamily enzyme